MLNYYAALYIQFFYRNIFKPLMKVDYIRTHAKYWQFRGVRIWWKLKPNIFFNIKELASQFVALKCLLKLNKKNDFFCFENWNLLFYVPVLARYNKVGQFFIKHFHGLTFFLPMKEWNHQIFNKSPNCFN